MVYRWAKINGISITGVGAALVIFALWATFITTAPEEQFLLDPKFATEYFTYYQGLTVFGIAMIIGGVLLYLLHRKSIKEMSTTSERGRKEHK